MNLIDTNVKKYTTRELFVDECELAYLVGRMVNCELPKPPVKPEYGSELTTLQRSAVDIMCNKRISIMHGLPGSGKTTTLKQVVASLDAIGLKGIAIAPSAKAVKRMRDVLSSTLKNGSSKGGSLTFATAHSALKYKGDSFAMCEEDPLPYDYIIMDECSMGGQELFLALFKAIDYNNTRLILVGDSNQLPSVDSGRVFHDMIKSDTIPTAYLGEIHRQAKNSGIIVNSVNVLEGRKLEPFTSLVGHECDPASPSDTVQTKFADFEIVYVNNPQHGRNVIKDYVTAYLPMKFGFDPLRDIQYLIPGHNSPVGVKAMNETFMGHFNPTRKPAFCGFAAGDKVICRKNMYQHGIINGDNGIVTRVKTASMLVDFGEGCGVHGSGIVEVVGNMISNIKMSYACTVHSSQGSEYPCVVLGMFTSHYKLLVRNLLYTGMTRPKKHLVIVGEKKAITIAIGNNAPMRRVTCLHSRIKAFTAAHKAVAGRVTHATAT